MLTETQVAYLLSTVHSWIRIALVCETVGCLPNPGGLFQQESNHIWKLEKVYQARTDRMLDEQKAKDKK